MGETSIARALEHAHALVEAGDQGDAEVLLSRVLSAASPATSPADAVAIAGATGLLIRLSAIVGAFEGVDDCLGAMIRLTLGFDDERTSVARAEAELQAVEWVHEAGGDTDPVALVDMLRRASSLAERWGGSVFVGVRRAAAEAGLTANLIRGWLGTGGAASAVALESLAVSLAGEHDERMRTIRVQALRAAATAREEVGDADDALALLRVAAQEGALLPWDVGSRLPTLLRIAVLSGEPEGSDAWQELFSELHSRPGDAGQTTQLCRVLERALEHLGSERLGSEGLAAAEWNGMLARARRVEDPAVRTAVLDYVRFRGDGPGSLADAELEMLRRADAVFRDDDAPETEEARFRVAARIAEELGHPADSAGAHLAPPRGAAAAVRFSEEIERRFPHAWERPGRAAELLCLRLDRALRLSDLERGDEAVAILRDARLRFAGAAAPRHLLAQAEYWIARFVRERGGAAESTRQVADLVDGFGSDPDPEVRIWAANALFSLWRAAGASERDVLWASSRFVEVFAEEHDVRFRRLDASRMITLAHRAHEAGDTEEAVRWFTEVVERHGPARTGVDPDREIADPDREIAESVRLAHENLRILALSARPNGMGARDARSYALRDRLYETDSLLTAGRTDEAVEIWREIVAETAGVADADTAMLGLAALDAWAGHLEGAGRWAELHDVARRATVIRPDADVRARRVRARAHLRLAAALNRLGDPGSAVSVYDGLEALAFQDTDDDIIAARQQAAYNRAVLIDGLGDVEAALGAYDHAIALHAGRIDSPSGRLRRVKALRNQALLLDGLGRIAEAATAHRMVLDITAAAPDAELSIRARSSAFDLAVCFARLGDQASAAATYAWIRGVQSMGFTEADRRSAAKAQKIAERAAKRRRT